MSMQASDNCKNLIKSFETYSEKAYKATDNEKYYTIGYGHYGSDVKASDKWSLAKAEAVFSQDLKKFEKALVAALDADEIEVNQNQFDALLSFTYNCGITRLTNSSLWKSLKSGIPNSDLFLQYKSQGGMYLAGLLRRRVAEIYLFEGADWHEGNDLVLEYVRIRRANNIMLKNTRQQTIDAQVYLKVDHLDGLMSFVAKHE